MLPAVKQQKRSSADATGTRLELRPIFSSLPYKYPRGGVIECAQPNLISSRSYSLGAKCPSGREVGVSEWLTESDTIGDGPVLHP